MAEAAKKQKIVICGGGNAAHVFTALAASKPTNEVHLLSLFRTEAKDFETELAKTDDKMLTIEVTQQKTQVKAKPASVGNDPKVLANSDIVVISLPAFAHNQYLNAIKDNIKPEKDQKCLVAVFPGASGLECEWQSIFGANNPNFVVLSCITLPWACRILQFGQKAEILGTKNQVEVSLKQGRAGDDDAKQNEAAVDNAVYIKQINDMIGELPKIVDFGHILNMSLSAVNAVVHPSIMYARWKDYDDKPMDAKPLFYQGIDEDAAKMLSDLSDEVLKITASVEKETGLSLKAQHIYDWYKSCYGKECSDTSSLYKTILTNPGYNGLTHPMTQLDDGKFVPNWKYRYLSEDIPYGLIVIRGLSLILGDKCDAPLMDTMIKWAQAKLGKEYLVYGDDGSVTAGKDIGESRAPQRYGIKSIKELV
mmetsp:Transcript_39153/g.62531  ORF Transcript_39153/g.62531 Transcript_39153/m.62531 type:complete len:422 (-) Transcript_39153:266-1531(-)